ncbi:MAG TPA: thioesterase family protein [Verrucomicrobiae bacterium]|nr:thioesterase family protein [Verrucomicrobiae bacterium]
MAFRYYLRVRYDECDAQKVVFNARYGVYADLAVGEFFRALGYGEQVVSGELDYQLVRQVTEWKSPARYDDVVEAEVRVVRIGTTSLTLAVDFRLDGRATLIATLETVYVMVDRALAKKPVPDALRAALERPLDAVTDHAARG